MVPGFVVGRGKRRGRLQTVKTLEHRMKTSKAFLKAAGQIITDIKAIKAASE